MKRMVTDNFSTTDTMIYPSLEVPLYRTTDGLTFGDAPTRSIAMSQLHVYGPFDGHALSIGLDLFLPTKHL